MRHIDDGALHAYLDGAHDLIGGPGGVDALVAHLAECAGCRARLEAERAVRDRAGAILGMGAPLATELPPFAELEARRDSGRRRVRGRVPLAWAATVVLALGAGWIARETLETPAEERLSAVTAAEPESRTSGSRAVVQGEDVDSPPTRAGTGEAAFGRTGEASPETAPATGARADRAAPGRSVAGDRAVAAEPEETRRAFARTDERREAVILASPPTPSAVLPESRAADPPPPRTGGLHAHAAADEGAAAERERERRAQQSDLIGEPVAAPRYPQAAAAPPPPPPPVGQIEQREMELEEIIVTGAAAGTAAAEEPLWRPIDRRAAEAALGRPILVVVDLPVIAIEQPATGPITTVRVRQRLARGGVLTLQQSLVQPGELRGERRAAAAAPMRAAEPEQSVAGAARPSLREVEVREEPAGARVELREGDLVVHARAPIPLDRLRALLVRLR